MNLSEFKRCFEKFLFRRVQARKGEPVFPRPEDVLMQPYLFVLSTGRCGTGLITEIFGKSKKLRVEHNPKPELEYASSAIHHESAGIQAQKIAVLAARFDLFFLDSYLRGKVYTETNNRISLFAPGIAELLPNAKFIHLVRNPADFVRSGMRRGYYKVGIIQHQRLNGAGHRGWNSFSRLEKVAWEWNEINSKIEAFKTNVAAVRTLTIKSEDLFTNPEITQTMFDFIELENPFYGVKGAEKLKRLQASPVNEQRVGEFPKFQDWSDVEKIGFKRVATLASCYGYFYNI